MDALYNEMADHLKNLLNILHILNPFVVLVLAFGKLRS